MRSLVLFALLRFSFRLELGPEFDSNANHALAPTAATPNDGHSAPIQSFLLQGIGRGKLVYTDERHVLRLTAELGGKFFFTLAARPQDTAVVRVTLDERMKLSRKAELGLMADYHDAYQFDECPEVLKEVQSGGQAGQTVLQPDTSCHRDFRLASVRAQALLSDGVPGIGFEAGARSYQWKPDDDLSFVGVSAAITPSARFQFAGAGGSATRDLILSSSGRLEYRSFNGHALRQADAIADAADSSLPYRHDLVASCGLQLSYSGPIRGARPLLASIGYLVETDRSSSAGSSYLYQALTASIVLSLPARFVAAARGELLFFQSGQLPTSLAVEDENRNSLVVDLSRQMGAGFTLHARYGVYRSGGSDGDYLRQLAYLGAAWETR